MSERNGKIRNRTERFGTESKSSFGMAGLGMVTHGNVQSETKMNGKALKRTERTGIGTEWSRAERHRMEGKGSERNEIFPRQTEREWDRVLTGTQRETQSVRERNIEEERN